MDKSGPHIRKRLVGRMSDGSDRAEVEETFWVAQYVDDDGAKQAAEFDHDPTEAEVAVLTPRRVGARQDVAGAVAAWQASQAAWSAATTVPKMLTAIHQEHLALMRAVRALARIQQIDD